MASGSSLKILIQVYLSKDDSATDAKTNIMTRETDIEEEIFFVESMVAEGGNKGGQTLTSREEA